MLITIDGLACEAVEGEFVMQVAKRSGIRIPGLCHHDALPGQACCRLCMVEATQDGAARMVAACVYPVANGMSVATRTENILAHRNTVLTLMRERAPAAEGLDGLYCEYGVKEPDERFCGESAEKCVMCGLCARACAEIGASAIAAVFRGVDKKIGAPFDEPPETCAGCGACARVCPTGAINLEESGGKRVIWGKTFTLLPCESCGAPVGTREELDILASRDEALRDQPLLCAKCRRRQAVSMF